MKVSHIFKTTKFIGVNETFNGIELLLGKLDIISNCNGNLDKFKRLLCKKNLGASSFLQILKEHRKNAKDYCLNLVISHRDFQEGTLGLAFVGVPDNSTYLHNF